MRLGDVMQQEHADMGISFCGSGGAGALTAATKYGYQNDMVCVRLKKGSQLSRMAKLF